MTNTAVRLHFDLPASAKAVHDYRDSHHIDEPILKIDWSGVFWRKAA